MTVVLPQRTPDSRLAAEACQRLEMMSPFPAFPSQSPSTTPNAAADVAGRHRDDHDEGPSPFQSRWLKVAVMSAAIFCESLANTMLLPFVGLLVSRFLHVDRESAGLYSGLLVGLFSLMMALVAPRWGAFGDRFGRRPAVLLALAGSAVAGLAFGAAGSFPMLVLARIIHGTCGASAVSIKAAVPEMADADDEAKVWSALSFASTLGGAVGPTIGGLLYDPAAAVPALKGTVFDDRPALLPCLIGSGATLTTLAAAVIVMPETNPRAIHLPSWLPGVLHRLLQPARASCAPPPAEASVAAEHGVPVPSTLRHRRPPGATAGETSAKGHHGGDASGGMFPAEPETPSSVFESTSFATPPAAAINAAGQPHEQQEEGQAQQQGQQHASFGYRDLWNDVTLRRVTLNFCAVGAAHMLFMECLPLLCIVPLARGGFAMDSHHVGIVFTAQAVLITAANATFDAVCKRVDRKRLLTASMVVYAVTLVAIPAVASAAVSNSWSPASSLGALVALSVVRAPAMCFYIGVLLMGVTAAAPAWAQGQVSGLTTSLNALARALAPIAGTPLFAWSIAADPPRAFPLNAWLMFIVAAGCVVAGIVFAWPLTSRDITRTAPTEPATATPEDATESA